MTEILSSTCLSDSFSHLFVPFGQIDADNNDFFFIA